MEESTSNCAIWAINLESIDNATEELGGLIENFNFYDKDEYFDTLKFSNYVLNNHVSHNLVSYATPFRMHERLSIQQGLFVFPCNLTNSFVDNLISTFNKAHTMDKPSYYQINLSDKIDHSIFIEWPLVKIIIPHDCHNSALLDLKSMNISAATLFPGLDGFARSLKLYYRGSEFDGEFQRALLKW